MTQEEQLIRRYFQTFNRHNIDGVMDCFHENPVLVGADGRRIEGRDEMLEIIDGKLKEIRDYHKRVRAAVADSVPVAEAVH